MSDNVIELIARQKVEGSRLEAYLASMYTDYSRSLIQEAIKAGQVQVNGKPAKASYRVRFDDHIRLELPSRTHDLPEAEDIPLSILYEAEYLAIINKPPTIVVHPPTGH